MSPSSKANKPKVTFSNFATCFTERQIKEWLSKAKQREDKLVYKAILLAIYTGMRLGEIGDSLSLVSILTKEVLM